MKFHFCQNDRYEIHTVLSFISPQFIWTQVQKWLKTEVRFSTEMKSRTVLSLFRLSYERTLTSEFFYKLAKVCRVRHAGKAALTVKTKFENEKSRVTKYHR